MTILVTLGVTPFSSTLAADLGTPTTVQQAAALHADPRWALIFRGFELDIAELAVEFRVDVIDAARNVGAFQGALEPSYALRLSGATSDIETFATHLGARWNQDAAIVFAADPDGPQVEIHVQPGDAPEVFYRELVQELGASAGASFDANAWRVNVGDDLDLAERVAAVSENAGATVELVRGNGGFVDTNTGPY